MTYAGATITKDQLRGTLGLLRYYVRFLASDYREAHDPEDVMYRYRAGPTIDKPRARKRLKYLINVAINRKAGIPDTIGRRDQSDHVARLWRDQGRLRDIRTRRLIVRQFETPEVRSRFSHLLTTEDDL